MARSPGFGSMMAYSFALFTLGFPPTPSLQDLILHTIITRWPVLQKVRYQGARPLYLLVSTRFQILFHSPYGVLFTFPSRYLFTIGHMDVFRLRRWSSHIPTGFLVSDGTLSRLLSSFSSTGLSPSLVLLSRSFN